MGPPRICRLKKGRWARSTVDRQKEIHAPRQDEDPLELVLTRGLTSLVHGITGTAGRVCAQMPSAVEHLQENCRCRAVANVPRIFATKMTARCKCRAASCG